MTITNYKFENIDNFEEFLNCLYNGLKYYESKNKNFKFKLTYTRDNIELKTLKTNESIN
jgi:hypothetical protein